MGCLGNSSSKTERGRRKQQEDNSKKIDQQLKNDKKLYRATHRLLLLGE